MRVDSRLNLHLSVRGEEQERGERSLRSSPVGKSDQNLMKNAMEKAHSGHTSSSHEGPSWVGACKLRRVDPDPAF